MIVLVGGEKGGTGKTTIATNLAVLAAAAGRDVLLLDTDPQGTSSMWAEVRDESGRQPRIPCVKKHGDKVHIEARAMADRYSDIIIDAGGRDSRELRAAMLAADLMLMPIQASQFDAWTLDPAAELVATARIYNEPLVVLVVINKASPLPQVAEAAQARAFLAEFEGLEACSAPIRDRIAFRHAAKEGVAVTELGKRDRKAVAEIEALFREVFGAKEVADANAG